MNFKLPNLPKLKVSRSRNMKQKMYEISTSPKIQTNSIILNNKKTNSFDCFLGESKARIHLQYYLTFLAWYKALQPDFSASSASLAQILA